MYAVLSTGLNIHLHYCCGKLAELNVLQSIERCCVHEMDHSCTVRKNCCQFEDIRLKMDQPQVTPTVTTALFSPHLVFEKSLPVHFTRAIAEVSHQLSEDRGPPLVGVDLCILHSSLVYYG